MRLEGTEVGTLLKGMEESFDFDDMTVLLRKRFGLRIGTFVAHGATGSKQMFDIHDYFDKRNTTERLIRVLIDARPDVSEFSGLAVTAGLRIEPPANALQVMVSPGRPITDIEVFRTKLAQIEAAICLVETANGRGTGCLVTEDLVITNHHVVSGCMDVSGALRDPVRCIFDHKMDTSGYASPEKQAMAKLIASSSPHAPDDLIAGNWNQDGSLLDYALLRLETRVGAEPVVDRGNQRGAVAASNEAIGHNDGVLVMQHPGGAPMKVDLGAVMAVGDTRIRHSVNTLAGSSGAPVFDGALNFVALHHAGHKDWPAGQLGYNQAIPIHLIKAHARNAGVTI